MLKEVLRENWQFILYERRGILILFIVNGQGSLSEVTYNLNNQDIELYRLEGISFLLKKVECLRQTLRIPAKVPYQLTYENCF